MKMLACASMQYFVLLRSSPWHKTHKIPQADWVDAWHLKRPSLLKIAATENLKMGCS
jgi:hypothetical protein